MHKPNAGTLITYLATTLLSCGAVSCEGPKESPPKLEDLGSATQGLISDQLHNGGTNGFFFLPPMVSPPSEYGDFLPGVPVAVRIDELSSNATVIRTLATFTSTTGPEGEHIRVHYQGRPCDVDDLDGDSDPQGYYYVRWLTNDSSLSAAAHYRVRVLVPSKTDQLRELGFADVDVVNTTREFRSIDTRNFTPLLNGTTLRIKFRIDWPAVDRDRDDIYDWQDNCPALANPDQTDSLKNGIGDACRCASVKCAPLDACHRKGVCEPTTGTCSNPSATDGIPCVIPRATATCLDGACHLTGCNSNAADCDGDVTNGCETSIDTVTNCGACGISCTDGPNSKAICHRGTCVLHCQRGHGDCDNEPSNGCEVDLSNDPTNCGTCGNVCQNDEGCLHGSCTTRLCQDGYADCNHHAVDGCETALASDPNNCGHCHRRCDLPNSTAGCSDGACSVGSCNTGFANCNAAVQDGCEVDIASDINNCGACSSPCALPNANPACVDGTCVVAQCFMGFADCDGDANNGCEVNIAADTGNCGSCGNSCSLPNATLACTSGACTVGSCNSGYSDCDGVAATGCEVNTQTDVNNCGACGSTCSTFANATANCTAGACGLVCEAGYSDCDANVTNGCETYLQDSCGRCGGCPTPPNAASGQCNDGVCGFSVCNPGFADCDATATNGCEASLNVDDHNCGACGNTCGRNQTCESGTCQCKSGFADCNGSASDGCEIYLPSSMGNCGSCGAACTQGNSCKNGQCVCPSTNVMCGPLCTNLHTDANNCGSCGLTCPSGQGCANGTCLRYCSSSESACAFCGSWPSFLPEPPSSAPRCVTWMELPTMPGLEWVPINMVASCQLYGGVNASCSSPHYGEYPMCWKYLYELRYTPVDPPSEVPSYVYFMGC